MRLPATKALALGQDALVLPSHAERLLSCTGRHCHYRPEAEIGQVCTNVWCRWKALTQLDRRPSMMMTMPIMLTATPSQSVPVGLTLSTNISQMIATPMYTPP